MQTLPKIKPQFLLDCVAYQQSTKVKHKRIGNSIRERSQRSLITDQSSILSRSVPKQNKLESLPKLGKEQFIVFLEQMMEQMGTMQKSLISEQKIKVSTEQQTEKSYLKNQYMQTRYQSKEQQTTNRLKQQQPKFKLQSQGKRLKSEVNQDGISVLDSKLQKSSYTQCISANQTFQKKSNYQEDEEILDRQQVVSAAQIRPPSVKRTYLTNDSKTITETDQSNNQIKNSQKPPQVELKRKVQIHKSKSPLTYKSKSNRYVSAEPQTSDKLVTDYEVAKKKEYVNTVNGTNKISEYVLQKQKEKSQQSTKIHSSPDKQESENKQNQELNIQLSTLQQSQNEEQKQQSNIQSEQSIEIEKEQSINKSIKQTPKQSEHSMEIDKEKSITKSIKQTPKLSEHSIEIDKEQSITKSIKQTPKQSASRQDDDQVDQEQSKQDTPLKSEQRSTFSQCKNLFGKQQNYDENTKSEKELITLQPYPLKDNFSEKELKTIQNQNSEKAIQQAKEAPKQLLFEQNDENPKNSTRSEVVQRSQNENIQLRKAQSAEQNKDQQDEESKKSVISETSSRNAFQQKFISIDESALQQQEMNTIRVDVLQQE